MSDLTSRIKEIAQKNGLSSTAIADLVEVPRPVMSHIFSGRNRPSLEVVQKVGIAFPELDLTWLLYGKGEMLKNTANGAHLTFSEIVEAEEKIDKTEPQPTIEKKELIQLEEEPQQSHKNNEITQKKVKKIVYFYDDRSFEEYLPA